MLLSDRLLPEVAAMCHRWGMLAAAGMLLGCLWAQAEEVAAVPDTTPGAQAATDQSRLIPQLDNVEFSERQAASQELLEAGKAVFPQLEKAAQEGSREASGRALDILKTHYARGDDETKQAAQAALERLAKSHNAGAAQRAHEILNPPKPEENAFNGRFGAVPIIRGANIQIQVAGNVAGARRMSTRRDANGKVEIEAEENGKKTKIVKQPDGSIEMEITETVNGKETTKKHSAKNYDELKMKDAEAAKIYDQYNAGGVGNLQIQAGFGPGLPGIPNLQRAPNVPPEVREQMIKSLERQIEQIKGQAPNNPSAQRLVEILQERKKGLEQQAPAEQKPAPAEKPAEAPPGPAEKPAN
jgi:hypothetical protein